MGFTRILVVQSFRNQGEKPDQTADKEPVTFIRLQNGVILPSL